MLLCMKTGIRGDQETYNTSYSLPQWEMILEPNFLESYKSEKKKSHAYHNANNNSPPLHNNWCWKITLL